MAQVLDKRFKKSNNKLLFFLLRLWKKVRRSLWKNSPALRAGSNHFRRLAQEPWILATNLPKEPFNATQVVNYYSKRMQIEQSFRDIKSHQFGLSARYASTKSIYRWGVKMLLAAIVQTMFWIIGVSPIVKIINELSGQYS